MAYKNKEDQLASSRRWYIRNNKSVKASVKSRKAEIRHWFTDLKQTLGCQTCPEKHPACLDFHHVDSSLKTLEVSKGVANGWNKTRIENEIKKCVVLCSNCHRKLHSGLA